MMAQVQKFVKNQKFAQSKLQQYLEGENLNTPILNQSSANQLPKRGSKKACRTHVNLDAN